MNTLKVSKEIAEKISRFGDLKSIIPTLKKEEETLKDELLAAAEGKEVIFQASGKDGAILGRVYTGFWKGLDQKKLWASYPTEAAAVNVSKPYLAIEVF